MFLRREDQFKENGLRTDSESKTKFLYFPWSKLFEFIPLNAHSMWYTWEGIKSVKEWNK